MIREYTLSGETARRKICYDGYEFDEKVWRAMNGIEHELAVAFVRPPVLKRVDAITVEDYWGEHRHTSGSNEIIHVLAGNATITIGKKRYAVGSGDTIFIPKATPHKDVRVSDTDYRVVYVFFDWDGGGELLSRVTPERLANAPDNDKQHVHALMKTLHGEYLNRRSDSMDGITLLLYEILIALMRTARHDYGRAEHGGDVSRREIAAHRRERMVQRVRRTLLDHYDRNYTLEQLAEPFDISVFHLCRSFSQYYGMAITDMLAGIRIEKAKELLRDDALLVKEVAGRVGFSSGNYFAKVFYRMCGESPSQYKARMMKT